MEWKFVFDNQLFMMSLLESMENSLYLHFSDYEQFK